MGKVKQSLGKIQQNGVVGAGGAGFPAYAKLQSSVEIVIANAAECEPLLHKDKELLVSDPIPVIAGLALARELTGARSVFLAMKKKARKAIVSVEKNRPDWLQIALLDDIYPAGDEFVLTHQVTGRIPPAGGIPVHVGVLVQNIETLWWMGKDRPVTRKLVTVAGDLPDPVTLWVPVGTSVREVLENCGVEQPERRVIISGGAMMGQLLQDLTAPVTKTLGGLIVLPSGHPLALRYLRSGIQNRRVNKSACDQCSFCTQLCPRYLLGHPIEPHLVMRHVMMASHGAPPPPGARYCCSCNLCSLWSCPEDLDPAGATLEKRLELVSKSQTPPLAPQNPHPMAPYRKPNLTALKRRLGLSEFKDGAPISDRVPAPRRVCIPLKQHIGDPASPVVREGQRVTFEQMIAEARPGQLSVPVHASIDGVVRSISDQIVIEKGD